MHAEKRACNVAVKGNSLETCPVGKTHELQGTCISQMDELINKKEAGVLTKEHGIWVALLIC